MSKKANQTQRKKGSDKRKNTFKKYGKNTTRGLRIKQADMEKKAAKRKEEGNHALCLYGKSKGKHCFKRSDNRKLCKITCRNKKNSKK